MPGASRPALRWLALVIAGMAALVALPALYAAALQWAGNIHVVVPDQVYRSAQLDGDGLRAMVATYGIRSVLNLRGAHPGSDWYDAEIAVAQDLGVRHFDFAMSANLALSMAEIDDVVAMMRATPKPILIHCRHGSDRTGLATALYQAVVEGLPVETAETQLSFRFGHVGIPYLSTAYPMDQTWEAFEAGQQDGPTLPSG